MCGRSRVKKVLAYQAPGASHTLADAYILHQGRRTRSHPFRGQRSRPSPSPTGTHHADTVVVRIAIAASSRRHVCRVFATA